MSIAIIVFILIFARLFLIVAALVIVVLAV
jgi:hypothetical protein